MLLLDLVTGAAASLPFAAVAARFGRISRAGATTGVLFGAITYAAFYLAGLLVLGTALILTLLASRVHRTRRGTTDADRGAANIIANCIIGVLAALLHLAFGLRPDSGGVWFAAAIAAGASDTVASEVGQAFAGAPRSFPTMRRVTAGTPGAVSIVGSLAGAVAAAVIVLPAAWLWLIPAAALGWIVLACTTASLLESLVATTLEHRGLIDNNALNVLNTAWAAGLAYWWA